MHILIIRFSSIGDIVQTLSVISSIKNEYPNAKITFLTKLEFADLTKPFRDITETITFDKKQGVIGLLKLAASLRGRFSHIYDAHSNFRSRLVTLVVRAFKFVKLIRRKKNRIERWLYFHRFIKLPPFIARDSYLKPLNVWNITKSCVPSVNIDVTGNEELVIAPSTNWPLKSWPVDYFVELIRNIREVPVRLIGKADDSNIKYIVKSTNVLYTPGTLYDSFKIIANSKLVLAGDTGMIHIADILNKPGILLMGPTAFGYTKSDSITILKSDCRYMPCTKDGSTTCKLDIKCKNGRCMYNITPILVLKHVSSLIYQRPVES